MRGYAAGLVAIVGSFVAGILVNTAAVAHAVLMDSTPKAGQMLPSSPKEVVATFNESVGPIFFKILDRTGKEVGNPDEIRLDGVRMILPLRDPLPNGTYLLTYRAISADTHAVGTTFGFSVGEPMADLGSQTAGPGQGKTAWTYAVAANRWLLYAMTLLAAGSALFLLVLSVPVPLASQAMWLGRIAALTAAAAYVLAIGVGGAEMVMGGGAALFASKTWANGLHSSLSFSAALGVPAMLLLIWAFSKGSATPRVGAMTVGGALALASFLVTGHAATAAPVWLMATAVGVHLLGTSFWMGALYPLYRSAQLLTNRESGSLMTQFSTRAVYAVAAIVVSGVIISWTQLASFANFLGNDYGTSLLLKLTLFASVIAVAAYNKLVLTPALQRGEAGASARIRRSIRVEYVVYILILGAAMSLTLTPPPRARVAQAAGAGGVIKMGLDGISRTLAAPNGYSLDFELTPARAGENMLMATVKDAHGQVLKNLADLEVVASLDSAGISDIRLKGEKLPNGQWHVMIKDMLIPGEWSMALEAFVSDFDKVEFATKLDIK